MFFLQLITTVLSYVIKNKFNFIVILAAVVHEQTYQHQQVKPLTLRNKLRQLIEKYVVKLKFFTVQVILYWGSDIFLI